MENKHNADAIATYKLLTSEEKVIVDVLSLHKLMSGSISTHDIAAAFIALRCPEIEIELVQKFRKMMFSKDKND
ncbi:MAG: hypothetical protein ACYDD5_10365 [Sulfuricurvum sp.]